MGYSSDVRLMVSKKGYKELKKYVNNYLKNQHLTFKTYNPIENPSFKEESNDCVYLGWNCIKWYEYSEGYQGITAIMKGLETLKEKNLSYNYARLGENLDDYEEDAFESKSDDEPLLEYPALARYFDDDYVIENMEYITDANTEKMKALLVKPDELPQEIIIDNTLKAKQDCVGGLIEYVSRKHYPNVAFICNEEGKIDRLPLNRYIGDDIIAGPFLIVGDEFKTGVDRSLTDEEVRYYKEVFNEKSIEETNLKIKELLLDKQNYEI